MAEIILTVYFNGTQHNIDDPCLSNLLEQFTLKNDHNKTKVFAGCGITYGTRGALFGAGIEKDCKQIADEVRNLIRAGNTVKLNCYGHSRGGITALMLEKKLGRIHPNSLETNLALIDVAPGNLLTTASMDVLNYTLANQVFDLSKCCNLKSVLSLYTSEPSPDIACHAPLFPIYPKGCVLDEDVIPGSHSGVQRYSTSNNRQKIYFKQNAFLTFERTKNFLFNCGTRFVDFDKSTFYVESPLHMHLENRAIPGYNEIGDPQVLCEIYEETKTQSLDIIHSQSRCTHAKPSVLIKTEPGKTYLNKHHKQLANQVEDQATYVLSITPERKESSLRIERHSLSFFQARVDTKTNFCGKITGLLLGTFLGVGASFLTLPCLATLHITTTLFICIGIVVASALLGYAIGKILGNYLGDCINDEKPLFTAPALAI